MFGALGLWTAVTPALPGWLFWLSNLIFLGSIVAMLLWTLLPVYHMVLFAISERDSATSGRLWPKNPTLQNFDFVFHQKHFYLDHFWLQMGNSLLRQQ